MSFVRVICEELCHAENLVGRIGTGHLGGRPQSSKFIVYLERLERLKTLYVQGKTLVLHVCCELSCVEC